MGLPHVQQRDAWRLMLSFFVQSHLDLEPDPTWGIPTEIKREVRPPTAVQVGTDFALDKTAE